MKVTPLAQGTGVPAQSGSALGQTASPTKLERAKAIASGEVPRETSGDPQVDKVQASIKKIKMNTQRSTNRHEVVEEPVQEVVQEPTQDTITDTVESASTPEETRPISPDAAVLMKMKRALQVKERELAQREEALKNVAPTGDMISKAELLANPLKVFEAGVTYDQLTEAILNDQNKPVDAVKLREEIKKELKEELFGELSTRDQQAEQQVLDNMEREVFALTSQGDQYEAIKHTKSYKDVVKLVHRVWQKGWADKGYEPGYIMDISEAADLVESQLVDELTPIASLKKIQSRLTPAQEQAAQTPPVQKPGTKVMRTLTNRDNASPVMDRRSRAIAAMNGTLKR